MLLIEQSFSFLIGLQPQGNFEIRLQLLIQFEQSFPHQHLLVQKVWIELGV
jgi:hypothetical protein